MAKNNISFGTTSIKSPCMNCDKRHVGCHSECKLYDDFAHKRDKIKIIEQDAKWKADLWKTKKY